MALCLLKHRDAFAFYYPVIYIQVFQQVFPVFRPEFYKHFSPLPFILYAPSIQCLHVITVLN
jgi:hypothetical protein